MWHGKGKGEVHVVELKQMWILGGIGISQKGKVKVSEKNQRVELNFLSSQVGAVRVNAKVNVKVNVQLARLIYRAVKKI